ncbi:hypothetical protein CEV32_0531 [Brucella rhizosphaerae]|uniref:Uncharacterized protein n=1 Tax=Brucella rhizosphaerae TaxID=571254 RepID=A0A256FIL7_9HYPH|nr:hypothetical protein CEV32_0531 [Brucella rhizosphaerae]
MPRRDEIYAGVKNFNYAPFGTLSGLLKVGTFIANSVNLTAF